MSPRLLKEQAQAVLEENVPVFAVGLGNAGLVVAEAHQRGMKVIGLAGTSTQANRYAKDGVDVIVAHGSEAGGHTGRVGSVVLLPEVVDTVGSTPVLGSGGIVDGRGIAAMLAMGAQGVWIGTAFLMSRASGLYPEHKAEIATTASEQFIVTRSYAGKPARDVRNAFIDRFDRSGLPHLPMPLQWVLLREFRAAALAARRFDLMNNPAGQGGGRLHQVEPAKTIFERLVRETLEVLDRLSTIPTLRHASAA